MGLQFSRDSEVEFLSELEGVKVVGLPLLLHLLDLWMTKVHIVNHSSLCDVSFKFIKDISLVFPKFRDISGPVVIGVEVLHSLVPALFLLYMYVPLSDLVFFFYW